MGLVNTVVPLARARGRDGLVVPRDARALPLRAAAAEGELPRRRGRLAGIQQLAHDANLLFYASDEAQEGREAYKDKRTPDFSQFPEAAMSPICSVRAAIWLMAARPRTLPAAVAPVLVGTALAAAESVVSARRRVRRRAARRDLHPGRDEPVQRLLRRAPRRRHRGPPRAGARHRRRPRAAAAGAARDLRRLRAAPCCAAST